MSALKLFFSVVASVILGWVWIDSRFDSKVQASEARVMDKVSIMRQADLELIKSIKEDTSEIKRALYRSRK